MGGRVALEVGAAQSRAGAPDRCCCRPRWPGAANGPGRRCCAWCARSSGCSRSRLARVVEGIVRRLIPGAESRLGRGRRRRVPARLPHAARPRRLLRRRAPHLPRGARGRGRLLDAPARRCSRPHCSCGAGTTGSSPSPSPRTCTEALPHAEHLELDCGHVPQLERPRETHDAMARFLRAGERAAPTAASGDMP